MFKINKFTVILFFFTAMLINSDELLAQGFDNSLKINVFAVVSPNLENAAKDVSADLYDRENIETFYLRGYQLHCTLYMTRYPEDAAEKVERFVKLLAQNKTSFPIETSGLEITSGDWFFLNIKTNQELQRLCDATVKLLAHMRLPSDYVPTWAQNMPEKVECITKYGSPNVYSQFNPHLTLLASTDGETLKRFYSAVSHKYYNQPLAGEVVGIGYGIADKDGQMLKPEKIFMFKK
ncbi:MAG: DUF1045 domain-containing protein [Candidatus Riflebacteria bacterium]|nr:DUF1045 domain-containing protein [Candidatus Riflebacteria bacterium]